MASRRGDAVDSDRSSLCGASRKEAMLIRSRQTRGRMANGDVCESTPASVPTSNTMIVRTAKSARTVFTG